MPSTNPAAPTWCGTSQQRALRAEIAGAAGHAGGGDAGALGVELVALAQPGEHVAAPVVVGDRELAQACAGLAGVDQRLQHAVDVMGDRLALEHADSDRVGAGLRWCLGGRTYAA